MIISKQKRECQEGECGTNEERSYDFQNAFFPRSQQNVEEYIFGCTSCGMFISGPTLFSHLRVHVNNEETEAVFLLQMAP